MNQQDIPQNQHHQGPSLAHSFSSSAGLSWSLDNLATTDSTASFAFLPDYTEHPKPKRRPTADRPPLPQSQNDDGNEEITFFHDFVAGGVAGCASVVVGHPFDTIKVRLQTGSKAGTSIAALFRGMGAPLTAATAINALVFGSYGFASRFYDEHIQAPDEDCTLPHDPWQKSSLCGSFAGAAQAVIICPMEHIKCRLQLSTGSTGPQQVIRQIVQTYGVARLFQGWWSTAWREIPAFGLYFASYDYMKDAASNTLNGGPVQDGNVNTTNAWLASAIAGGFAGSLTWGVVYPIDVIKTRIQTTPLNEKVPTIIGMARKIVETSGYRALFRGLGITLLRAFPVNGTIFPIYEFTLKQVMAFEKRN